jgi:uncharacterized protein DUF4062
MPRQSAVFDVFLSSPGDLETERDFIVAASQEWNLLRSRDTGCYINIITWEDTIAPSLSDRPQQVINDQVGDDYDIYLGMMWSRLGSPTGEADSGTVEEFDRALDRYRAGEGIRLAMLFKTAPIPTHILNGEQFDKVTAFKLRFAGEGGVYREFDSEDSLRSVANRLFEQIAAGTRDIEETVTDITPKPQQGEQVTIRDGDDLSDIGILDLNDQLTAVVAEQAIFLGGWQRVLESNTEKSIAASAQMEELTRFGAAQPSALRPIMARMSSDLVDLSKFVENNIGGFIEGNNSIRDLTEAALDLSRDFPDQEHAKTTRLSVVELLATLLENRNSLDSLIATTSGLPRMTTEFNRAKKRAVKAEESMLAEIDRLRASLTTILSEFDQTIVHALTVE